MCQNVKNVHSNIIYRSPKLEITQMSIKSIMNKYCDITITTEVY